MPVGLFGEHRNTIFTFGVHWRSTSSSSSLKPSLMRRGTVDDVRALNARGHRVHAEGRRADHHRILPGATERATEEVDGFVAAAAYEHLVGARAVEGGQPRDQLARLRLGIAIQAGRGVVAQQRARAVRWRAGVRGAAPTTRVRRV